MVRNQDYEVRSAGPGRGDGVFALRELAIGEKIFAERSSLGAALNQPVASADLIALPASEKAMLMSLSTSSEPVAISADTPVGESAIAAVLQRKFTNNAMGLGDVDGTSGLFLTIAKVNHDCVGNSEHYYLAEHGLMLLVATATIAVGEEITFSCELQAPSNISQICSTS